MIGKAHIVGAGGLEHGKDLIDMGFRQGIEEDQRVIFPGGLLIVVAQVGEHAAVLHVVAEQGDVVAGLKHVADFGGVDAAADGVVLVKILVQVEVGIVHRGLHHGVVDLGILDLKPANHIGVLVMQLLIPGQEIAAALQFRLGGHVFRLIDHIGGIILVLVAIAAGNAVGADGGLSSGLFGGGVFIPGGIHQLGALVVRILLLGAVGKIGGKIQAAGRKSGNQHQDQRHKQSFFHGLSSKFYVLPQQRGIMLYPL